MEEQNRNITLLADSQPALKALSGLTDSQTKPLDDNLVPTSSVALQIASEHVGLDGNEVADIISKERIDQPQPGRPIRYFKWASETRQVELKVKTLVWTTFKA